MTSKIPYKLYDSKHPV